MQQYTYGLHVFNISKNKIIPFGLKIVHEAGVKKKKKKKHHKKSMVVTIFCTPLHA
jgi:uncharacterized membrane protein YccF (DUF307 family)